MITTERPGFGASTRAEGRTFVEHTDDTLAILDSLRIDALPVYGASGASPHILDLAARHPERVTAATILVGAAPLEPAEAAQLIDLNALEYQLIQDERFDEVWQLTSDTCDEILADPLAGFRAVMDSSTDTDRAIIEDPGWQRGFLAAVVEALRAGPGGWYDENLAIGREWEIDFPSIDTDLTWWHGDGDRNAPLSAARRIVDALPNARLRVWPDAGHLTPYRHEREILDELLSRARP